MCILEFLDENEHAFYHLERFIEGEYIKYNSNSGFVSDFRRMTPQVSYYRYASYVFQLGIILEIREISNCIMLTFDIFRPSVTLHLNGVGIS